MLTQSKARPVWDKGEKRFLVVSVLMIGVFGGTLGWWGRLNEVPEYQIPAPFLPSPNAYDTYTQAFFLMAPPPTPSVDELVDDKKIEDPKERAVIYHVSRKEAWLAQNAGALKLLRQGLKQQFLMPPARSWSAPFPQYSSFRNLALRLQVESKVHRLRGRNGAAAQSALDILQFGHQILRGGPMLSSYSGLGIQNRGRLQLFKVLPHLSAAECKSAARRLEKIRGTQVPYAQTLREEKWMGQASLIEFMKMPDWSTQLVTTLGTTNDYWQVWRLRFVGKGRVLENFTRYLDALIVEAQKPYAKAQEVPLPDDEINQSLMPSFLQGRFSFARNESGSALLLASLALRAYRLENGAYPDKLSALVPRYLLALPADGFGDGAGLRYKKQGSGYKLWSIGPDKKDNGGAPLQQQTIGDNYYEVKDPLAPHDTTVQGDWVLGP